MATPLGTRSGGPCTRIDALPSRVIFSSCHVVESLRSPDCVPYTVPSPATAMSLIQATPSTLVSPAGAPVFMLKRRMTATLGSVGVVPPSRSATYSMPLTMSEPKGSFNTSGGVKAARSAEFCTPIQRAVWTEPS